MTDKTTDFDVNTLLQLIGKYKSEHHFFDITMVPINIEYNVTLNGGEVEVVVETSDDDFSSIKNTETFTLQDGSNVHSLSSFLTTKYLRYYIDVKTIDNTTPRIHYITMNGSDSLVRRTIRHNIDMLLLSRNTFINNLADVLILKYDLSSSYIYDLLTSEMNIDTSNLFDTFLRLTLEEDSLIDTILQLRGIYKSYHHRWAVISDYYNLETDVTLYGCDVDLIIEVSNDNFNTILDTKSVSLSNGSNLIELSDLSSSLYIRYRLTLKTEDVGITPRIHSLILNASGEAIGTFTKSFKYDLLTLKHDLTTSFLLNVLLGDEVFTYFSNYNINSLLEIRNDLSSNLDLILSIAELTNISLDTLLKNTIKSKILLDVALKAINDSSYHTDIILSHLGRKSIYKDVVLEILNKSNRFNLDAKLFKVGIGTLYNNIDTILEKYDIDINSIINLLTLASNDTDFNVDTYLELINCSKFDLDTKLISVGTGVLHHDIDTILEKYNIGINSIIDLLALASNDVNFGINIPIESTESSEFDLDTGLERSNIDTSKFNMDLYSSLTKQKKFLIDFVSRNKNERSKFNIDVAALKIDNETNFVFSTILTIIRLFIDYAKQTSSSLFGMNETSSNLYDISNTISSSIDIDQTSSDIFNTINEISNVMNQTNSDNSMFSSTVNFSSVYDMNIINEEVE